jgi:hypothetical protein
MSKDEIIEMGTQVGIHREVLMLGRNLELLTDFAKLLAKHTLLNIDPSKFMSYQEGIEAGRFAEREACAKEAERTFYSVQAAENIRARGQE